MKTSTRWAVLALLLGAADANAYNLKQCENGSYAHWPNGQATLRASKAGFPEGSQWRSALQSVANTWSTSPSALDFTIAFDQDTGAKHNGISEVWWTAYMSLPAAGYFWLNGDCEIVEGDVIFKSTVDYTTSTLKTNLIGYGGDARPFQTTAMHEFGHAQGLGHVSNLYNIMGQDFTHIHVNASTATAYPGQDALAGAVVANGAVAGTFEDLGIAHWRFSGVSGEYSLHARTRVFTAAGALLPTVPGAAEPTYVVTPGQVVRPEFTFENMGKSFHFGVKVRYYLSTNSLITVGDIPLAETELLALTFSTPLLWASQPVTLPQDLQPGTNYWLGAIVNYDASIAEYSMINNATYIPIRVN